MGQGHDLNFSLEEYLQILSSSLTGVGEQLDGGVLICDLFSIFWNYGMFWTQIYLPEPEVLRELLPFLSFTGSLQIPFLKVVVVSRSKLETKTTMFFFTWGMLVPKVMTWKLALKTRSFGFVFF